MDCDHGEGFFGFLAIGNGDLVVVTCYGDLIVVSGHDWRLEVFGCQKRSF